MSTLRVNQVTNEAGTGAVEFSQGIEFPANSTLTTDITLTGVCTSTSFSGNGSGLTASFAISNSKLYAYNFIL